MKRKKEEETKKRRQRVIEDGDKSSLNETESAKTVKEEKEKRDNQRDKGNIKNNLIIIYSFISLRAALMEREGL